MSDEAPEPALAGPTGAAMQTCPMCHQPFEIFDLVLHIMHAHPAFFQLWVDYSGGLSTTSLFSPIFSGALAPPTPQPASQVMRRLFASTPLLSSNILPTTLGLFGDEDDEYNDESEMDDYETLLNICDFIGPHRIGVSGSNLDKAAPLCGDGEAPAAANQRPIEKCPICLETCENLNATGIGLRAIAKCGHRFCDPCITKWLSDHTSCPICKKDVRDDEETDAASADASEEEQPATIIDIEIDIFARTHPLDSPVESENEPSDPSEPSEPSDADEPPDLVSD